MNKVYEVITDRILERLEQGEVPWHKPWNVKAGFPKNLISKKDYRGINVFLTGSQRYESPYWLTFRQAKELGGNVRKGEKGTPCIFWKWLDYDKENQDTGEMEVRHRPMLRYYTIFNVSQCDLPDGKVPEIEGLTNDFDPIPACEGIVDGMPNRPKVEHGKTRACYNNALDTVSMPNQERFEAPTQYYNVIFHELTHSTGHASRLDRPGITAGHAFGDQDYSKEELVAEMGASFLCGAAGIENDVIESNTGYIAGWLKSLKNDKKLVVMAAAQAQKAADHILNVQN